MLIAESSHSPPSLKMLGAKEIAKINDGRVIRRKCKDLVLIIQK